MRSAQASPWFTDAVLAFYRRAMFTIGALTMSLMVVIVMAEVVCRYGLGFSIVWSEELCRILLIWITFLFGGLALDRGEVIALEFLTEWTSGALRAAIVVLGGIASLVMLVYLAKLGLDYALFSAGDVLPAMQISMFWVYLAVPVGLSLFAVHLLFRVIRQVRQDLGLISPAGA